MDRGIVTNQVYCRFEGRHFPADEFEDDEEWGLIHAVKIRHTAMGSPLDDGWAFEGLGGR